MSYTTLMVNLDVGRSNNACLHVAGELAARFGARLIGVAAADFRPPLYFAEGDAAAELIENERGWHDRSGTLDRTVISTYRIGR